MQPSWIALAPLLAPLLAVQALPIDTVSELMRLGGWGALLLFSLVFLWALFRSEPLLYGRHIRLERDQFLAERDEERERCVKERERGDHWQEKYESLLIQQIAEMRERDRVIEILTRDRGFPRESPGVGG